MIIDCEHYIIAGYWVFFVLAFAYNNYNLLFSMKYWVLSLKLESLMMTEQELSQNKLKIVRVVFYVIQVVMLVSGVCLLIFAYMVEKRTKELIQY